MAKKGRRSTASRGSVNNIILESLYSGRKYGYEIIKQVEIATDGDIVLKQPSLYSSLTRFENKGYVTSSWADSEIGGRRHYYELTPLGRKYYENNVLNKKSAYDFLNDDYVFKKNVFDEDDDIESESIIDNHSNTIYNYDEEEDDSSINTYNYQFDVQDKLNSLLDGIDEDNDDNTDDKLNSFDNDLESFSKENESISTMEEYIDEYVEVEGHDYERNNEETITRDEDSYSDNNLETTNESKAETIDYNQYGNYNTTLSKEFNDVYESIVSRRNEDVYPIENDEMRAIRKKESMEILYGQKSNSNEYNANKYIFNESRPTYYIDENGITKQFVQTKDDDFKEDDLPKNSFSQIATDNNLFNSSDFDEIISKSKNNSTKKNNIEENAFIPELDISDEDREERNRLFQEKFDMIADSRLIKPQEVTDNYYSSNEMEDFIEEEDNDDSYYFSYNDNVDSNNNEEDESNIISSNIKMSAYDNSKSIDNENDRTNYIKINKAKFILGIVMLSLMILEITTLLIILNNTYTMTSTDNILFITSYILTIAIACILILPAFINANKRKLNNFKFGYSLALSILSFFVLSVLTYAINSFLGFDLTNIEYFYTKLILPILISFNLIVGTIVYKIIIANKKLY